MAQKPSKSSGTAISNIIDLTRGAFTFRRSNDGDEPKAKTYGSSELISPELKNKLLRVNQHSTEPKRRGRGSPVDSVMAMMSGSYSKVGQERLENRRILELMPDVRKATRLMIASIFSPSDLARHEIAINFTKEGIQEETLTKLGNLATAFFQRKLNLKTAGPKWVYQFGYESGSSIFAIVPLQSFEKIHDDSYIGSESFINQVVDPICRESLFGFGDSSNKGETKINFQGLESFGIDLIERVNTDKEINHSKDVTQKVTKELIEKFVGQEALSLTDNPSVLRVNSTADDKRKKKTKDALNKHYKNALHEPMIEISPDQEGEPEGNPMMIRLPPESVTIIHTPGEPSDHQGYLVMLDIMGNPVSIITQEADEAEAAANLKHRGNDLFAQIHQAYGLGTTSKSSMDRQTMGHIYNKVVTRHLEQRLGKAGYGRVEIPNIDAIMRSMFTRMLQEKRTRILFLPKELVTYMTFEVDQYGYGVSKLNGVKFALGMKMALQVSRVLAAIKAAMDKRLLTMKFDENMMEQPEAMFDNLVQQFIQKNAMTFSTDPGYIQSQIQQKSITVKAEGIPGMENFSVSNEADAKSGSSDFDSGMTDQLDKQIINGLDVPASAMNSLAEDEYARSISTTNLFFAMEVSIYQDAVIKHFTDLIRKYGRYSAEFQKEITDLLPELKSRRAKSSGNSSTDEVTEDGTKKDQSTLPEDCTLADIIDAMEITLPKPNIAPSKAQFESLDGMITAITNMMGSLFPDELAGSDDKIRPVIALLRARFTASNIRSYLESVGMSGIDIPEGNSFSEQLSSISVLHNGLQNLAAMLEGKAKLAQQPEEASTPAGY